MDNKHANAYYYLALTEHKRGNKEKVLYYLDKVTSLDQKFYKAYYNKGIAKLSMDMPEEAIRDFSMALTISPRDEPSFLGLLEAYDSLDSGREKAAEIKTERKIENKRTRSVPAGQIGRHMEVCILSGNKQKNVDLGTEDIIELQTDKKACGILKIDFPGGEDLRNKNLGFRIKGEKGMENINIVIRDSGTRRSVPFHIDGITVDWQDVYIDFEKDAYNINTASVSHVRFELIPSRSGTIPEKVFIRDIRFPLSM